jgi:hypothetical protein
MTLLIPCVLMFSTFALSQTFKKHHIVESVQEFFAVATIEDKGSSNEYPEQRQFGLVSRAR